MTYNVFSGTLNPTHFHFTLPSHNLLQLYHVFVNNSYLLNYSHLSLLQGLQYLCF